MKNDLVEKVKSCFTSNVVAQLSAVVDEPEPSTRKALNKAVPLVLKGLLNRVERGFAPEVLLDLVQAADTAEVLKQLSKSPASNWSDPGTNLLLDLLGDTYRSTVNQAWRWPLAFGPRPAARSCR
ncbi:DUF937 domain-containing protein [Hymenobacter humi]|uniref:DUF937 domain-containing protein n=1 Tax=Hymenobacter humi TaxID=1411620 RepID=A0ABW2U8D8_9BACT